MSKFGLWAIAGIAISTLLYLVYTAFTFEAPTGTTTVVIAPPGLQPIVEEPPPSILPEIRLEPEPPAIAVSEPVLESLPVEVVELEPVAVVEEPDSPVVQLPTLNDSDGFVFEGLRAFSNGVAVIRLLASDQLVRKFVVLMDNISRGEYPQSGLPYRRIEQEMPVQNIDENLFVMDASAHGRFDQIIDIFVALDTDQALTLYRTLSPLFQQAYAEIGFRNVNFDDTLRSAVNIILRTPYIEGPYQLVKPSVMYLHADASIENLQNVQKQLIRIGPENTEKVKAKLRDFVLQL